MKQLGGIGPAEGPTGPSAIPEGVKGQDQGNVMQTPVRTLGDLKRVLVEHFGEKEGTKAYNGFIKSFAMMMLAEVQRSASQAKKAAQRMRQDVQ